MSLDITALKAKADALVASQGRAIVLLQALSTAAGGGGSVSQADIDAITAELSGAQDALDAEVSKDTPVPPAV